MKKNRNCGMNMYPAYTQAMPMMGMQPPFPGPIPMMNTAAQQYQNYNNAYNNVESQMNNIQEQINSLENRVAKLEAKNSTTYNNKYNDSNYYML